MLNRIVYILCFVSVSALGQSVPLQSQYMFNPVALNPASTGSEEAMSIVGSFRAQWIGVPGSPTTQWLTAHAPLKKQKSAVGLQFNADQIGVDRKIGVFASYAYRLHFERAKLAFGVSGGLNMIRSYYSSLAVNDPGDQEIMNNSPVGILPDFSLGVHFYSDTYFISFSLPMFISHYYDGNRYKMRNDLNDYNFILGGGYQFNLRDKSSSLKPSILLKYRKNYRLQADINLLYQTNKIIDFGLGYRTEEAIVGLIKVRANKQFNIMYSYGFPMSPLIGYQYGSHEIGLKYNFLYETKIQNPRFLSW